MPYLAVYIYVREENAWYSERKKKEKGIKEEDRKGQGAFVWEFHDRKGEKDKTRESLPIGHDARETRQTRIADASVRSDMWKKKIKTRGGHEWCRRIYRVDTSESGVQKSTG